MDENLILLFIAIIFLILYNLTTNNDVTNDNVTNDNGNEAKEKHKVESYRDKDILPVVEGYINGYF